MKTSISMFAVLGMIGFSFQAASGWPSIINPKALLRRSPPVNLNNLGTPTARYKQELVARPRRRPSYCHISYINQDCAGGTCGASYARFAGGEQAGCP